MSHPLGGPISNYVISAAWRILVGAFLIGFIVAGGIGACTYAVFAHDGVFDNWYESLKQPGGYSCCNKVDCKPVEARMTAAGYQVWHRDQWLGVDPSRVITDKGNPVGRPVACIQGGMVLCFVPGAGA